MLEKFTNIGFSLFESALIVVFGALGLIAHGAIDSWSEGGKISHFSVYDIEMAFLYSFGFMIISGYLFTLILSGVIVGRRQPLLRRIVVVELLFLLHLAIFLAVNGDGLSQQDLWLVFVGLISICIAEMTAAFVWRIKRVKSF